MKSPVRTVQTLLFILLLGVAQPLLAQVTRIEITERRTISEQGVAFHYEAIHGLIHFVLDPEDPDNQKVVDIQYAPRNGAGLVEYAADFKLLVPSADIANGSLVYMVNNRGNGRVAPEISLSGDPLSKQGFTWLLTGWINELEAGNSRLLLHAPVVGTPQQPITGMVRYEITTGGPDNDVNIAGGGHLAYLPTEQGLRDATLTSRLNLLDPRVPLDRSRFSLAVAEADGRNQPVVTLNVTGGIQPGRVYELIYEAMNPVLSGAGMAGIRDSMSLLLHPEDATGELAQQLAGFNLPPLQRGIAIGNSQSGRLLRLFLYEGFNADLAGRQVFAGVIPVITGAGMGMFNNRFAMPTRTNGQHENLLYPNDLFPFTYGDSTDPFSGRSDAILKRSRESGTEPRVMHIQTSHEYWGRAASLPHTDPLGTVDAVVPDNVRFYTLGGSQHGSGNGQVRPAGAGQLPNNPNLWAPFEDTLLLAMHSWLAEGVEPPPSRYPRIADGSLVPSHLAAGRINPKAWNPLPGINHPKAMYQVGHADYGPRWMEEKIIDHHPLATDKWYVALVPAVNSDNNDSAVSTVLSPLTQVPVGTFVPWNLRAPATGAETELLRLTGGYVPLPASPAVAVQSQDPRNSVAGLYPSFEEYLARYEAATNRLITEGYLLPEYKEDYMAIARSYGDLFP
ncbi:MAG: hypothetical protein RLZZ385_379 [Pseudomonadota bacterium]|jgi:hypothetical protein